MVIGGGQTRRELLKSAVAAAAGLAVGPRRAFAQAATERLGDNLFVVRLPGEPNVLAHTSAAGVLLVDGCSAKSSDALMKTVAALPGGGAVHTLFNTHWHPEQTGSNETVGKAGKTIIAQENTKLWLQQNLTWPWNGRTFSKLPKIAQPNESFYTAGELADGIKYGYIPDAAHTDGDLYVHFTQQNVLAVGDAMSGAGWPVVDWISGGWIGGIVGGLQRLATLTNEQTKIVPANGRVLTQADLKAQYEMYGTVYDRLTQMLNKGRGPQEAVDAKPTKEFDAQMGNGDEFVRRSFESLWAYLSPDA